MKTICIRSVCVLCSGIGLFWGLIAAAGDNHSDPNTLLLASFESGAQSAVVEGDGRIVSEHATDGTHAYLVESTPQGFAGIRIVDASTLRKFPEYSMLKVDVFNPQNEPVFFHARIDDSKSHSYGSRFNKDDCVAAPGKSTFECDLTSVTRSNVRNFNKKEKLDMGDLKLVALTLGAGPEKRMLYFDNIRLVRAAPTPTWLKAFDFGPAKSAVFPGFESCNEATIYSPQNGWGLTGPVWTYTCWIPDGLTRDCAAAKEFTVALPNGRYEVQLGMDPFGMWGQYPGWLWRKIVINGREVLHETRTPHEVLDQGMFAHEDDEDLPGENVWDKFIAPYQKIRMFPVVVTDGMLRIEVSSDTNWGKAITFAVIYPETHRDEGRKWMTGLTAQRRESFTNQIVVNLPVAGGPQPVPDTQEKATGWITFVRHSEKDIPYNAQPEDNERHAPLVLAAASDGRADGQIGLYPLLRLADVNVSVSDLTNGDGGRITSHCIQIRKVRNFLRRSITAWMANLRPFILQDFQTLELNPGVTRGLWLTVRVPADAQPGRYTGTITIRAGNRSTQVPMELTVYPFVLDKITDITMSVTGAKSWKGFDPQNDGLYWKTAELVMKNMAEHGMNAVTGGPGAVLRNIKNGKADIDYTSMDRWLALAVKYGLTMAGDSYQGLDIAGIPMDLGPNSVANNEAMSQKKFGVSYADLIRIVFDDVERHAKEKGWPPRVYSFLDEPRPEYGNIASSEQLIRIRTAASPDTLFAGYYAPGAGRDVYFGLMPVSIAQATKHALELGKKSGKQVWEYDMEPVRYNIGRWCFAAARLGLRGYLRNGYAYVCSDPYFDFSDDEASWAMVYPSRHGINNTVGWERTAEGVEDYRYLAMCERLIEKANSTHRALPQAQAASAFLSETMKSVDVDNQKSAGLTPEQYDQFRKELAGHITMLSQALD